MDYQTIAFDITDGLAVIMLNRPEKMNALNTQMRAEIAHAVTVAGKGARALVLTGAGRAFCTGQDLGDGDAVPDLERVLRDEYVPMIEAITQCPIPTIAAVNGPAAGAGANLALATDVVIATESAYFLQAFSRIGLIPDAGGTWMLPRKIGMAKAMGASLFADRISARQAEDWGMIWEAVADSDFESRWKDRAIYLATGPTQAFSRIKRAIRHTFANDLHDQLALEAHYQGECGKSRDFQEGVLAFAEKRAPKFEGR